MTTFVKAQHGNYAVVAYVSSGSRAPEIAGANFTPGFQRYNLSPFVTQFSLRDTFNQPAQELQLTVTCDGEGAQLRSLLDPGTIIRVFGDTYSGTTPVPLTFQNNEELPLRNELFRGYVFTRSTQAASAGDQLELTAYDPMIYLSLNEYDLILKKSTATQMIKAICLNAFGRQADSMLSERVGGKRRSTLESTGRRIKRVSTKGLTLYDACLLALQKNQKLTGKRYRLYSRYGRIYLEARKDPTDTWTFDSRLNIIEASHSVSIENLATRVVIKSQKGDKQRRPYVRTDRALEQKYGSIQKIVDIGEYSASEMRDAKRGFLRDYSKPEEEISIRTPIIASLQPGAPVYVYDDDLGLAQAFWVEEVTHEVSPTGATSSLSLVRREADVTYPEVDDPTQQNTAKAKYKVSKTKFYATARRVNLIAGDPDLDANDAVCTVNALNSTLVSNGKPKFDYLQLYGNDEFSKRVQVIRTHRGGADIHVSPSAAGALRPVIGTTATRIKVASVIEV